MQSARARARKTCCLLCGETFAPASLCLSHLADQVQSCTMQLYWWHAARSRECVAARALVACVDAGSRSRGVAVVSDSFGGVWFVGGDRANRLARWCRIYCHLGRDISREYRGGRISHSDTRTHTLAGTHKDTHTQFVQFARRRRARACDSNNKRNK